MFRARGTIQTARCAHTLWIHLTGESRHGQTPIMKNDAQATSDKAGEMRLISRAASILKVLAEDPSGLSLAKIADRTSLPRATIQRLVAALRSEGLIARDDPAAGARLGPELARIALSIHRDINRLCRRPIEVLAAEVEDTVDLTMLVDDAAVVVDQVSAARALRVVSQIGSLLPLHCTASGKAHLSHMARDTAQSSLRGKLRKFTPNTIVDKRSLFLQIDQVDEAECFRDSEEFALGVLAFALPIRGLGSGNYAIAVSVPKEHGKDRYGGICLALRRTRKMIEVAIGAIPDDARK
jgi:IclR family transcriptional regulator, acetate operon repressor